MPSGTGKVRIGVRKLGFDMFDSCALRVGTPTRGFGAVRAIALLAVVALTALATGLNAQNYTATTMPVGMTPITGGTVVFASDGALGGGSGDDSIANIALPFPFKFYGVTYSSINVTTNACLSFGTISGSHWNNQSFPSTTVPNAVISSMWDDYYVYRIGTHTPPAGLPSGARSVVSHRVDGVAPNRVWTIEFLHMVVWGVAIEVSSQVKLFENGAIEFHYATGQNWGSSVGCSIGVENATGTVGLNVTGIGTTNNTPPTSNYRLEFTNPLGYFSNFEASSGIQDGWSVEAVAPYSSWEWGTPATAGGPTTGASGSTNAWTVNRTGNYLDYTDTKLTSPTISLSGAITPLLTFQMNMGCESGYDGGVVRISRNGGAFIIVNRTDPAWLSGAPNHSFVDVLGVGGWSGTVPSATGYQETKLNLFNLTTTGLSGMTTADQVKIQFYFESDFTVTGRGWTIDDFRVDNPPQDDVGVTVITSPASGSGNRAAMPVTITISNFGGTPQSSFPVSYQITAGPDGAGSLVTETYNGPVIQPATTGTYTFTATVNANTVGAYTITASTGLASDGNSSNNSTSKNFNTLGFVNAPYFTSFETNNGSADGWLTGGTTASLWQWGAISASSNAPSTGANGTTSAWQTGLNMLHNTNNAQAYLETPALVLAGTTGPRVSFFMSMHSENNWDGGIFQISRNGGAFVTVSRTDAGWIQNGPNNTGLNTILQAGWSGTVPSPAGAYQEVVLNLFSMTTTGLVGLSASDEIVCRFWFHSDNTSAAHAGWTIDEFRFFNPVPSLTVGLAAAGGAEVLTPASDVVIGAFDLGAVLTSVTVSSVTLAKTGTADAADVSNYRLWVDADASGTLTAADLPLAGPVTAGGANVVFSGSPLAVLSNGQSARVLVTANLASSGAGKTFGLSLTAANSIVVTPQTVIATFPVETPLTKLQGPKSYPYFTDFESASGLEQDWSLTGGTASLFQWGTPVPYAGAFGSGPTTARSGSKVWGTNLTGDYVNSAQAILATPYLSLSGAIEPELSWWMHLDSESAWDGFSLQISRNGGAYTTLLMGDAGFTANGPNDNDVDGVANLAHGWSGEVPVGGIGWAKVRLNLFDITTAGLTGMTTSDVIRARFWFGSDSIDAMWPGLYIDDVRLGEAARAPVVTAKVSGATIANNGSASVPYGSTVASRAIEITSFDPDGNAVTLSSTVSNTRTHNGIVASEFGITGSAQLASVSPLTGTFNFGGGSHLVTVTSSDGEDSTVHTFTINVADAPPATLAVGSAQAKLGASVTIPVSIAWAGNQVIGGVSATIAYSGTALTFVSGALAAGQPAGFSASASANAGIVTIGISDVSGNLVIAQGAVIDLTFTVQATAALGNAALQVTSFSTLYPGGGALHTSAKSNTLSTDGFVNVFATPPTISVTRGGFPVGTGTSFTVPYNSTLASVGLSITTTDVGENVSIATTMPTNAASAGLVSTQFNAAAGASPVSVSPTTGTFTIPDASYVFSVIASDGFSSTSHTFTIVVGPNTLPTIVVRSNGATLAANSVSQVGIGSTLASLGLNITVSDSDGDQVSLTGTVSNVTTQGILNSQFSAATAASPLSVSPTAGTFAVPGAAHVVMLSASDGNGTPVTMSFTLQTRANAAPTISVLSSLGPVANNGTVNVPFKSNLATLGLSISVADSDGDTATLSGTVSNNTAQGFVNGEFGASTATATPFTRNPLSGSFNRGGVSHVVTLTASDSHAQTTFTFTIAVAANNAPTIVVKSNGAALADAAVVNVAYNSTLAALKLTIDVGDLDGDPVSLAGTVSNSTATQGLAISEFNRISSPVPYSRTPLAGLFNVSGATHVISLTADDGFEGITVTSFSVVVGQNSAPEIRFTREGVTLSSPSAIGFLPSTSVASIGLGVSALDPDLDERLNITANITGMTSEGIVTSEFTGNGALSPFARAITSGMLSVDRASILITVTATDLAGATASAQLTLSVASELTIATTSLPNAVAGSSYSASVTLASGAEPFTFSGSEFPSWLSINSSTGALTGTPPRELGNATQGFSVTVIDGLNRSASRALEVRIDPPAAVDIEREPAGLLDLTGSTTSTLFDPIEGPIGDDFRSVELPFLFTFFGTSFNSINVSPNGFILFGANLTGAQFGPGFTPLNSIALFKTQFGMNFDENAAIRVSINSGATGTKVNHHSNVVISFENLSANGVPGSNFSGQIVLEENTNAVSLNYDDSANQNWGGTTVFAGMVGPTANLVVDPFGMGAMLSAPPSENVTFAAPAEVVIITSSLPSVRANQAYTGQVAVTGGTGPYLFFVTEGPTWLTINSASGALSGVPPESAGGTTATFTVTVTDSNESSDSRAYTITINPALPSTVTRVGSGGGCAMAAGGSSSQAALALLFALLAMAGAAAATRRRA